MTRETHGKSHTALHKIWLGMKNRCNNPRHHAYARYGGRGIGVCERWQSFSAFEADMGERPSPLHSVDRMDNDRGYSPDNCRWATRSEQSNNRGGVFRDHDGRTLREIATATGIPYDTLHSRYIMGDRGAELLRSRKRPNFIVEYDGKKMSIAAAVRAAGFVVRRETARNRIFLGWSIKAAVETPVMQDSKKRMAAVDEGVRMIIARANAGVEEFQMAAE